MANKFKKRDVQAHYKGEAVVLAPWARTSAGAEKTRVYNKIPSGDERTPFQRDRDRILHSKAFRRLMHKTQVFFSQTGEHIRNRLTHTLETMQIAVSVAKAIGLNEELTEAIVFGHDLGHTPFGHTIESLLQEILSGNKDTAQRVISPSYDLGHIGGFKHNWQSLKVVDVIENPYEFQFRHGGLDLTAPVREGILKHTKFKGKFDHYTNTVECTHGLHLNTEVATTLEGQVVAQADEIAQRTHDFEDGLRSGVITLADVQGDNDLWKFTKRALRRFNLKVSDMTPKNRSINRTLASAMIGLYINDVVKQTMAAINTRWNEEELFTEQYVTLSDEMRQHDLALERFLIREVYNSQMVNRMDSKAWHVISSILRAYYEDGRTPVSSYMLMKVVKLVFVQQERKNCLNWSEKCSVIVISSESSAIMWPG